MALPSRSRTVVSTSGPGRGPGSDGRTRHRAHPAPGRPSRHHRTPSADALRLRAEALFASGPKDGRTGGNGPPGTDTAEKPEAGDSALPAAGGLALPATGGLDSPTAGGLGDPAVRGRGIPTDDAPAAPEPPGPGMAWRERFGPALRERMPLWLQSRCGLERRSVAALGVLLVVAVVFAAQHFWSGRTQQVRAPEVVRAAAPYGAPDPLGARRPAEPVATAGPRPTGGAGPTSAAVVVDVAGKVRKPGLLRLPAGSRVADALRAAGGVRPGTDTDGLNRARLLVDGEQIVVGGGPAPAPGPDTAARATGRSAAGAAPLAGPVSLSTATVDQLDTLPGVGPVLAQHIIDYRSQHGGFRSVDELRDVNGIGERRFADLRNLVRP